MISILHLHCIVPGGGISKQGKWKGAKSNGKYLFSVRAMSKVFRGLFIAALKEQLPAEMDKMLVNQLYKYNWVVYAKRPFADPRSVVEYLGRYTHKAAFSNHCITGHENGRVTLSYKDYKHGSVRKDMTLDAGEFIRRFSLHILPKGFVRIRQFGILSSSAKEKALQLIIEQVPDQQVCVDGNKSKAESEAYNLKQCPCCKKDTMETVMHFSRLGPPPDWKEQAMQLLDMIKTGT